MKRRITYPGALPRSSDFLGFEKDALYSVGDLIATMLGTATAVRGLVCAPTGPPSLNVTVDVGAIYSVETVDQNAFGIVGTDNNSIVKQGLLASPATLTITPPGTTGFSQVYLVQANYNDVDSNLIALSYFNSANPLQPLNGPNNSGTPQYTVRDGVCAISLKAGAAATTGTQTAPATDAGKTALYQITVANGATTITSGNIVQVPGAPFVPLNLPQVPAAIQHQAGNYAVDTGSANAMAITLPFGTTLTAGMPIRVKKGASANTGALTLTVNSGSPFAITWEDTAPFTNAQWPANGIGEGIYDGTALRMHGPMGPSLFQTVIAAGAVAFFASTTWTVPAGVFFLKKARVWGAGGGGGGSSGVSLHGSGGGAGDYEEKLGVAVTPGASITVTIGAAGAGGVGAADGGAGGSSIFGSSSPITAGGGGGGSNNSNNVFGAGGTGSGGDISLHGSHGSIGQSVSSDQLGGHGGVAAFGAGGAVGAFSSGTGSSNGSDGFFPAGGGAGAATGTTGTAANGGAGGAGMIIVEY